ncbi:MAG: DNA repair protein RecN [Burkholderiaceae bacterium]|jgi:DNA repair protein RecN (Recombination protein N)
MLTSLIIRDFVIVDRLELDFTTGLTVLSGETGAGKSILIDALALCLGERGDAAMVREGAAKAEITAVFDAPPAARVWLSAHDLDRDDELIVRRIVDAGGKSKAYINQTPVSAGQLKQLSEFLVDIHGQHAFQTLVKADEQRRLLDDSGGYDELVAHTTAAYRTWQTASNALETARNNQETLAQNRERLAWQHEEIARLAPQPGQWETLSDEHHRLSHAAELLSGIQSSIEALTESDDALLSGLAQVIQTVEQLHRTDPSLGNALEGLRAAEIQLSEAERDLAAYLRRTDLDPERLTEVDQTLSQWHAVARKLHIRPEALAERATGIEQELQALASAADLDQLQRQVDEAQAVYQTVASALSQERRQAATRLSEQVTAAMQSLSLPGGAFACELQACTPQATGLETVEFRVAGHAGVNLRPLHKVASGGELARISLAIAVITSGQSTVPTMIFDEVDSGIGGAVAEVVGHYLRQLAGRCQVLCVTHLPQVAAQGHQHWVVSKQSAGTTTVSRIAAVNGAERIEEIARMLGGRQLTETTRAAAKEMLQLTDKD